MATNLLESVKELDLDHLAFEEADGKYRLSVLYGDPSRRSVASMYTGLLEGMLLQRILSELAGLRKEVAALRKREKVAV